MVSPELIRRYPFFSDLSDEELRLRSVTGTEVEYEAGTVLFRRRERLDSFFIVVEGEVDVAIDMTARDVVHDVSSQLTGTVMTEDIVVSTVIPGEIFGWSALFPPFTATAAAKTSSATRVIQFNASDLLEAFDQDTRFGYKMSQKLALVIQGRLQDRRIELLSQLVNNAH